MDLFVFLCVCEIFLSLRIFHSQFLIISLNLSFSFSSHLVSGSSSVPNLQEAVPWASANTHAIWWYSGAAHPVVMARQHAYKRERKKGGKWEYEFDTLFFMNIYWKTQWNGSSYSSFFPYCDINLSVTDYRKRKNVGWGLGFMLWLLSRFWDVGAELKSGGRRTWAFSIMFKMIRLNDWRCLAYVISLEDPVMTFWYKPY